LGGETAEIVARDVAYIERLAGEYGESVYKNNPEFGVLHYIKELFGEEGLKVFAGTVFSHEGSYWRVRKDGGLDDDGTANVEDAEGIPLESNGRGRQGVLADWLGLSDAEVYRNLMGPAGYIFNAGSQSWDNKPGISAEIIEQAWKAGVLKEEGYQKMQDARRAVAHAAAGLVESFEAIRETDPGLFDSLMSGLESLMEDAKDFGRSVYEGIKDIGKWVFSWLPWNNARQGTAVQETQVVTSAEYGSGYVTVADNITNYKDILAFYEALGATARNDIYVGKYTGEKIVVNGKEYDKNDTFCNIFLYEMIKNHFGEELVKIIIPTWPQRANDLCDTFAGNTNLERMEVRTDTEANTNIDLRYIQNKADEGELIIVAFKVTGGTSGHVAFVGPSGLTINARTPLDAEDRYINPHQNEIASTVINDISLVIVHAGTYSGVTGISRGTNGWSDLATRNSLLENSIRFYRVKKR
jgi:hypothetical protein